MFLTWAARHRESHVRFIGDAGSIDWIGGVLRLEREGKTESFDYSAQLDKSAYPGWFAGLFNAFADAIDTNELESSLTDIGNVAAVLEGAYEAARSGRAQDIASA
jgi:predicted dehydrogenase